MHIPRTRRIQSSKQSKQRRFAASTRAHNRRKLSLRNRKVQALQNVDRARTIANRLAKAFYQNHRRRCRQRQASPFSTTVTSVPYQFVPLPSVPCLFVTLEDMRRTEST